MTREIEFIVLGPDDGTVLENVRSGTFDLPIIAAQAQAFLDSDTHEIAVARHQGQVVGFASAVMMYHPDKPPTCFINEVGVNTDFQRRGIARRLTEALFAVAKVQGFNAIWLVTEYDNIPARG